MNRRIATVLAVLGVGTLAATIGPYAWSQGQSVITTAIGTYYITLDPGPSSAYTPKISLANLWATPQQDVQQAGTGTGTFLPMGKVFGTTGTTGVIANGTIQGVGTYVLPANSLSAAGKRLHITAVYNHGSNGSTTAYNLNFANSQIATTDAIINDVGMLEMWVTQAGTANYQLAWGKGQVGTTNVSMIGTSGLNGTTSTDISITARCGGTNSNCFLQDMEVDFVN